MKEPSLARKEASPRKQCENSCSQKTIENCSWSGKVKLRCKGQDIHPSFRESFCGHKRVARGFPCCLCDLLEKSEGGSS
jgi:hypothetical protein